MNQHSAAFCKVSFEQFKKDFETYMGPLYCEEHEIERIYENIQLPTRATKGSAGYDFHSPIPFTLKPNWIITIPTGIRCVMDPGLVLVCVPRSGSGFKYGIRLMNSVGIIDSDYANAANEGHIHIKLHNSSPEEKIWEVKPGDGIAQGILMPYYTTTDDNADQDRVGGFGSTGR